MLGHSLSLARQATAVCSPDLSVPRPVRLFPSPGRSCWRLMEGRGGELGSSGLWHLNHPQHTSFPPELSLSLLLGLLLATVPAMQWAGGGGHGLFLASLICNDTRPHGLGARHPCQILRVSGLTLDLSVASAQFLSCFGPGICILSTWSKFLPVLHGGIGV